MTNRWPGFDRELEEWSEFMGYNVSPLRIFDLKRQVAELLKREGGKGSELSKNANKRRSQKK